MSEKSVAAVSWAVGAIVTVATIDVVSAGHGVADIVDALGSADIADAADSAGAVAGPAPGPVHFGGTVDFPDGTSIENPHQDALGYVYENTEDYMGGANKHVLGG